MNGRLLSLLLLVLLTACAGRDGADGVVQETDEEVAERYDDFPPAAPQRCIPARQIRSVDPVGDHSLLFVLRNGDVWRSRMRSRCLGLNPRIVLSYDVRSASLCAGDIVDMLDRLGMSNDFSRVGACTLGEFDYLTEEQADAFRSYE